MFFFKKKDISVTKNYVRSIRLQHMHRVTENEGLWGLKPEQVISWSMIYCRREAS